MECNGFSKRGSGANAVKDSVGSHMHTSPLLMNLYVSEYEQITSFPYMMIMHNRPH